MSEAAITRRDDDTRNVPGEDTQWDAWVSASRTRNFVDDDPLLDWLDRFGDGTGFVRDTARPGYDARTDFLGFVFQKANEFEDAVMRYLRTRVQVVHLAKRPADIRDVTFARRTWQAMADGVEVVAQGVLWNPELACYGAPDLLVRSDVLARLFPSAIDLRVAAEPATDLPGARWHYRVVDVKFTTLDLRKDGHAGSGHRAYMAQVWLYNEALGRLQGLTPQSAFLLGRAWKHDKLRGSSALDRLERVDRAYTFKRRGGTLAELTLAACAWIRRLRAEGATWSVLPEPTIDQLRPNMRHTEDAPWHGAKVEIATQLEDLTLIPRVNPVGRAAAIASGLCRWTTAECCAARVGVSGPTYGPLVDAVIRANQSPADGPILFPVRVAANEGVWRTPAAAEFYVDFETVNDIDDDFASFPTKGGKALIFMVGCGHLEDPRDLGSWRFNVFTSDRLDETNEKRLITDWLDHLGVVCSRRGTYLQDARLYHWSPAEESTLSNAYNAASVRHGLPAWDTLPWIDLLNDVVKAEPVTVRGAFGFGLKAMAKALHRAGLISTNWTDGPTDGLGAMVGAWACDREAARDGKSMREQDLMRSIEAYNEVDCKAMAEILALLRTRR